MKCPRCHNIKRWLFKKCLQHNDCYYCLNCRHIKYSCLASKNKKLPYIFEKTNYTLNYELTPTQKYFTSKLTIALKTHHVFINAVCGCGKTELLYSIICNAVNKNKQIAIIVPRITLLLELCNRFNRDFNIDFCPLYADKQPVSASVFMMTPQKILDYKDYFDIIIVDEIDAFPLYKDKVLYHGIEMALNKSGRKIFMSATPFKVEKQFQLFTIYKRYHNYKLPVPFIKPYRFLHKALPINTLMFFPSISSLEKYANNLTIPHLVIHSRIKNQNAVIKKFRAQGGLLLTTTILERGVTFQNINVIVYNCSHSVFTKNVLIQIAGRVNRHHSYQHNNVYFIDCRYSIAMYCAIKHTKEMNKYLQMSKLLFEI